MESFEVLLREQATKSLTITGRVLDGELDIPEAMRKTALSMINGQLKKEGVNNGRITQIISLTKLGVRDAETREKIALTALAGLLPQGTISASAKEPAQLQGALDDQEKQQDAPEIPDEQQAQSGASKRGSRK